MLVKHRQKELPNTGASAVPRNADLWHSCREVDVWQHYLGTLQQDFPVQILPCQKERRLRGLQGLGDFLFPFTGVFGNGLKLETCQGGKWVWQFSSFPACTAQ